MDRTTNSVAVSVLLCPKIGSGTKNGREETEETEDSGGSIRLLHPFFVKVTRFGKDPMEYMEKQVNKVNDLGRRLKAILRGARIIDVGDNKGVWASWIVMDPEGEPVKLIMIVTYLMAIRNFILTLNGLMRDLIGL